MRILFVTTGGDNHPSSRVRARQFMPELRKRFASVSAVSMHGTNPITARVKQAMAMVMAWRADVVVIQYLSSAKLARGLMRMCDRVLWDIDDGVFLGYPVMETVMLDFERIVVGNRFLAEHVQKFNSRVTIIPSVVDESRFPIDDEPAKQADPAVVTIGWIGHPGGMVNFLPLQSAFETLRKRYEGRAVFKVVSGEPFEWGSGGPAVKNKAWKLEDEVSDVRSFDIGIMPLADTPWNRNKCAYKALLYMSQAVPTVVSPVGVNADVIRDDVNGFHATTAEEWADKLGRLVEDAALRKQLGEAGRKTIREGYTVAAVLPALVAVLEGHEP